MSFKTRIRNKRDTASNWETNNPVLLDGELIVVDTNAGDIRFKIGDGTKTYTQLPFQVVYNALSGKAEAKDLGVIEGTIASLREDIDYVISTNTPLPTITTADNGKFLRAVDGVWSAVMILNAEDVSF